MEVLPMMLIICFGIGAGFGVLLAVIYMLQARANRKRIERGEPPKKYHNIVDEKPPVRVIDYTKLFK